MLQDQFDSVHTFARDLGTLFLVLHLNSSGRRLVLHIRVVRRGLRDDVQFSQRELGQKVVYLHVFQREA